MTTSSPQPSPTPQPTTDETVYTESDQSANWKTYTDAKFGFTIKYPDDYFKFQGDPKLGLFVATSTPQGGDSPKFLGIDDVWLNGSSLSGINITSLDQYLESISYYASTQKIPIMMNGINGYKVIYTLMVGPAEPLKPQYVYEGMVLKDNKLHSISMASWSKNALDRNQNTFNQILSTFRFLNNTTYNCPSAEWVNCMPMIVPGGESLKRPECEKDYLTWAKANCPVLLPKLFQLKLELLLDLFA